MQTDPWSRFLGWQVRVLLEREGFELDDTPPAQPAPAPVPSAAPTRAPNAGRRWWARLQRRRAA